MKKRTRFVGYIALVMLMVAFAAYSKPSLIL